MRVGLVALGLRYNLGTEGEERIEADTEYMHVGGSKKIQRFTCRERLRNSSVIAWFDLMLTLYKADCPLVVMLFVMPCSSALAPAFIYVFVSRHTQRPHAVPMPIAPWPESPPCTILAPRKERVARGGTARYGPAAPLPLSSGADALASAVPRGSNHHSAPAQTSPAPHFEPPSSARERCACWTAP